MAIPMIENAVMGNFFVYEIIPMNTLKRINNDRKV